MVDSNINGLGNNYDWTKGDDNRKRESRSMLKIKAKVASTVAFLLEHNRPDLASIVDGTAEPPAISSNPLTNLIDELLDVDEGPGSDVNGICRRAASVISGFESDYTLMERRLLSETKEHNRTRKILEVVHMIVGTDSMCTDWCGKSPTQYDSGKCGWCKLQDTISVDPDIKAPDLEYY